MKQLSDYRDQIAQLPGIHLSPEEQEVMYKEKIGELEKRRYMKLPGLTWMTDDGLVVGHDCGTVIKFIMNKLSTNCIDTCHGLVLFLHYLNQ